MDSTNGFTRYDTSTTVRPYDVSTSYPGIYISFSIPNNINISLNQINFVVNPTVAITFSNKPAIYLHSADNVTGRPFDGPAYQLAPSLPSAGTISYTSNVPYIHKYTVPLGYWPTLQGGRTYSIVVYVAGETSLNYWLIPSAGNHPNTINNILKKINI